MWTFATIPFRASFHGPDPLAIARRCRELGWAPDEWEDAAVFVDGAPLDGDERTLEELAAAHELVELWYEDFPELLVVDRAHRIVNTGAARVPIEVTSLLEALATVPFEVASFQSPYETDRSCSCTRSTST